MLQDADGARAPSSWLRTLAASGMLRIAVLPLAAVCAVLTARITILATGVAAYGYINAVAMLFLIIPMPDLGVGATVSNLVARRNTTPDGCLKMYRAVLSSCRILIAVCAVLTTTAFVITYSGALANWLGIPKNASQDGNTPMFLCLLAFCCSIPFSLGHRILVGAGRNTLIVIGSIITPATTLVYTYTISLIEGPPLLFALGPSLGLVLTNLFATVCAVRSLHLPIVKILADIPKIRTHTGTKVMDTAWPMMVVGTAFTVIFYSHRVLLARFSDATELATYALVVQLFFPAWSVIYMAGTILWSEFAVSKEPVRIWYQANAVLLFVSICGALGLYFVGPVVIDVMSPETFLASAPVLLAFGVLMVVMGLDMAQTMLLVSARSLRVRAYWALGVICLFAVLCIPAIQFGGAEGIIWLTAAIFLTLQTIPNFYNGYKMINKTVG